jgi:lysozyme
MTVIAEAIELICAFEGYHRRLPDDRAAPYLCPAAVPTIGFGTIWRLDGTRVTMADPPITRVEALARLGDEVSRKCETAVDRHITVQLHPLMRGALVSWTYNLGAGALAGSTLKRVINARSWGSVTAEFAKWRMAKGVVLAGLVRRREAEAAMFMRGVRELAQGTPPPEESAGLAPGEWHTIITRQPEWRHAPAP